MCIFGLIDALQFKLEAEELFWLKLEFGYQEILPQKQDIKCPSGLAQIHNFWVANLYHKRMNSRNL